MDLRYGWGPAAVYCSASLRCPAGRILELNAGTGGKYHSPACWQLLTLWPRTQASQAHFSPSINMVRFGERVNCEMEEKKKRCRRVMRFLGSSLQMCWSCRETEGLGWVLAHEAR